MYVIITCKYEKDPIKNSREKSGDIVFPIISHGDFFRRSRAANYAVGGPIRPKFEFLQALMHVIVTCKYEKEQMKNSQEKVKTQFFHHSPICYHGNQLLNLAEYQTYPSALPASMKSIRSRTAEKKWTHSHYKPMGIFSDVQGQLTPQSVVRAG